MVHRRFHVFAETRLIEQRTPVAGRTSCSILTLGSAAAAVAAKGFEEQYSPREVRRDSTATIVATGASRADKRLLVNGVGITNLTPITKMMVHLPNAFLPHPPRKGLVICFGMGTTHLSMLSWGIESTAVELVPSVPGLVSFFHPNAAELMKSPRSRVVIDDGRSYLERSSDRYNVITINPPPPVEAAGSSLLYSKEFYSTAIRRLTDEGILQRWLPQGDPIVVASVARALHESFPYVRASGSNRRMGHPLPGEQEPEFPFSPRRNLPEASRRRGCGPSGVGAGVHCSRAIRAGHETRDPAR